MIKINDENNIKILKSKLNKILKNTWTSQGHRLTWNRKYTVDNSIEFDDNTDNGSELINCTGCECLSLSTWISNEHKCGIPILIINILIEAEYNSKFGDYKILNKSNEIVYINDKYTVNEVIKILDEYNPCIPEKYSDAQSEFNEYIAHSSEPFKTQMDILEYHRQCEEHYLCVLDLNDCNFDENDIF